LCRLGFSVSTGFLSAVWSSVGASAMEDVETDVVMVDDGETDLFKICMLWIGSFWNDDVSSDSVAGVENRAERTRSSRRGSNALRCTNVRSVVAKAPMTTYHTACSHPNSLLIVAHTPVGPCSPNRSNHWFAFRLMNILKLMRSQFRRVNVNLHHHHFQCSQCWLVGFTGDLSCSHCAMYWSCGQWATLSVMKLSVVKFFGSSFCGISRKQQPSALKQLLHHWGGEWTFHLQFLPFKLTYGIGKFHIPNLYQIRYQHIVSYKI
ncbi:hypothetical protein T4A_4206, partial [Trichinella pseudospiralis]